MSMRPHHRTYCPIQHAGHGNFLRSCLRMDVHKNNRRSGAQPLDSLARGGEWILQIGHEHPALEVHDSEDWSAIQSENMGSLARCSLGIIQRPEKSRLVLKQSSDFLLIPKMVSTGDDINPGSKNLFSRFGGNAGASSGVFAVGDDGLKTVAGSEPGEELPDSAPARLAHDIADEQKFHWQQVTASARARRERTNFAIAFGTGGSPILCA